MRFMSVRPRMKTSNWLRFCSIEAEWLLRIVNPLCTLACTNSSAGGAEASAASVTRSAVDATASARTARRANDVIAGVVSEEGIASVSPLERCDGQGAMWQVRGGVPSELRQISRIGPTIANLIVAK